MFLPFGNSNKEVMIRRAKALLELLLPCLALTVVVFSFLPSRSRPIPTYGQVNEQAEGKFVTPDTTSSTSKKLVTYTILGTF